MYDLNYYLIVTNKNNNIIYYNFKLIMLFIIYSY